MEIIYIGGYSEKNRDKNHFYTYCPFVKEKLAKGKKVVFVTFAQPDAYYFPRLIELYGELPDIIDNSTRKDIIWSAFDLIYLPGGSTENLKSGLLKFGFDINKLKTDVTIIGDSAGANVMSKYYFKKEIMNGEKIYSLQEGLNPNSNLLTICHVDNPEIVPQEKLVSAKELSQKLKVQILLLKENESFVFEV